MYVLLFVNFKSEPIHNDNKASGFWSSESRKSKQGTNISGQQLHCYILKYESLDYAEKIELARAVHDMFK